MFPSFFGVGLVGLVQPQQDSELEGPESCKGGATNYKSAIARYSSNVTSRSVNPAGYYYHPTRTVPKRRASVIVIFKQTFNRHPARP